MNDIKRKGREGESALAKWFNDNGLGYVPVCQSMKTFAMLFNGAVKRPDFLVLLDSLGLIAVDAKNHTLSLKKEFTLEYENEFRKSMTFERVFRIPVWYVYMCKEDGQTAWYWISALKAVIEGQKRLNKEEKKWFLAIERKHFVRVVANADLGGLYTQRVPGYGKIRDMGQ